MTVSLLFGIDSLDELIRPKQVRNTCASEQETSGASENAIAPNAPTDNVATIRAGHQPTTVTIIGPDGVGKSVLALHMASHYWSLHDNEKVTSPPIVLYASTDLSYSQCQTIWTSFGLNNPALRADSLLQAYGYEGDQSTGGHEVDLTIVEPSAEELQPNTSSQSNAEAVYKPVNVLFGTSPKEKKAVYFLDLQAKTAGDDWSFINGLLGRLPKSDGHNHLLIVDAVEGLETYVGQRDAFGRLRSRRSRVAQLVRNAVRAKVHVVLVVEEQRAGQRLPEQFIADTVIRLRLRQETGYLGRTIEVEKCRGIAHVRGEHQILFRNGAPSSTGKTAHLDDPEVVIQRGSDQPVSLAHVCVIPSIHQWNAGIRREKERLPSLTGNPSFGIDRLDSLLKHVRVASKGQRANVESVQSSGAFTCLIGDAGTYKSRLAEMFLAKSFAIGDPLTAIADALDAKECNPSAAILITTSLIDTEHLRKNIVELNSGVSIPSECAVYCRRLSVRHMTSGYFLWMIEHYIRAAYKAVGIIASRAVGETEHRDVVWKLSPDDMDPETDKRNRIAAAKIRIVIDDWRVIQETHPSIANDPLLLHSVILMLKRAGVNAVVVSTENGQPNSSHRLPHENLALRGIDETRIFTWNVPFFGKERTAITVSSGKADSAISEIFELIPRTELTGLDVDQNFSLYSGIELGAPRRIPLVVRLYSGAHSDAESVRTATAFPKVVSQTLKQIFEPVHPNSEVVTFDSFENYDDLLEFSEWLDEARLEHTLVFQIDEFWNLEGTSLADLREYWDAATSRWKSQDAKFWITERESKVDIHQVFQPHLRNWERYKSICRMNSESTLPSNQAYADDCRVDASRQWWNITSDYPAPKEDTPHSRADYIPPFQRSTFFDMEYRQSFQDGQCVADLNASLESMQKRKVVNRIPFVWDFGFILARKDLWSRCANELISTHPNGSQLTVRDVWNTLAHSKDPDDLILTQQPNAVDEEHERPKEQWCETSAVVQSDRGRNVSWIDFLSACEVVAKHTGVVPFDIDINTAETLSCLGLEMWASIEFDLTCGKTQFTKAHERWGSDLPEDKTQGGIGNLHQLLSNDEGRKESRRALFASVCMLLQSCRHLKSRNRRLERPAEFTEFAACRQWYSTSVAFLRRDPDKPYRVLRLPGHFSTRGDWFLAVADGSRSRLLAHQALDILSSRKMNLLRLHDGLGLPVRDIFPDEQIGYVGTALERVSPEHAGRRAITLEELAQRGAMDKPADNFYWLWRSAIPLYDRHCFYWRRWLGRAFEDRQEFFSNRIPEMDSLRRLLDLDAAKDEMIKMEKSFTSFDKMVEGLRSALIW